MKIAALWAAAPLAVLVVSPAIAQHGSPGCGQGCNQAHGSMYADSCEAAYHENAMWPQQYISPSRRAICQATETMIHNGWRRHNLLGKYHFEAKPAGEQLTEAGRLKVNWILTQAPPSRRSIYVERAAEQVQTAERIGSVQELAANFGPAGQADVQETHLHDEGHSAAAVDATFTGFTASQKPPALPQAVTGSTPAPTE